MGMFIAVCEWEKGSSDPVSTHTHTRFTIEIAYRRVSYLLFSWEKHYFCTRKPQFAKILTLTTLPTIRN